MKTVLIHELFRNHTDYTDQTVRINGWVRTVRSSKNFGFMEVNDGTFFKNIQMVFSSSCENFQQLSKLPVGSSVSITGKIVETPEAKQDFECQAESVSIVGDSSPDYPLQKKRHSFDYLRTIAHLRPRSNTFSAVFRLRSKLSFLIHRYFQENRFIYVHTPILSGSDAEGAGEMFQISNRFPDGTPFFGKESGLTVSGQLEAEIYAMAFQKVYTFGPTFRAENSNTPRHASEFWMIEPEIAFAGLTEDMELAEDLLKYLIKKIYEENPEEMEFFGKWIDKNLHQRLEMIQNHSFERIPYTEAMNILQKSGKSFEYSPEWGSDLQTEHERYLTEEYFKKPVFVIDYPKDTKAFYMRLNDDEKTVAAVDLLVPGVGEIIGGSQREERPDILKQRMNSLRMNQEDYWWYLELRKYGGTPHAGFGLGFERLLLYLTGMSNIRDVIPFPRTPNHIDF